MTIRTALIAMALLVMAPAVSVQAEVRHEKINDANFITHVTNDPWQPEGFDEALILRAARVAEPPTVDGVIDDPAWADAEPLTVPLAHGAVGEATLKAVYTEDEIFLLVTWSDPTRDDQYHPWVWNAALDRYVEGPHIDDGLLLSFEAGCEWVPSLLSGYVFDFDGWLWLAARTDPVGQAVDASGHVQKRWIPDRGYVKYESRNKTPFWNLKFNDHRPEILTASWRELGRAYLFQPVVEEVYVSTLPDGRPVPAYTVRVPAPPVETPPGHGPRPPRAARTAEPLVPQYRPVPLTGDAGEVAAKGRWENGRWTVELRRALVTPAGTATDAMFTRVTQFSLYVFDHTERVDEAAESGRLFLQFEPARRSEKR